MEAPEVFPTLINALEDRGIAKDIIEKFHQHWLTLGPQDRLSCPLCFAMHNQVSALKPLPASNSFEPVKCEVCKEYFYIPLP